MEQQFTREDITDIYINKKILTKGYNARVKMKNKNRAMIEKEFEGKTFDKIYTKLRQFITNL